MVCSSDRLHLSLYAYLYTVTDTTPPLLERNMCREFTEYRDRVRVSSFFGII